MSQAPPAAWTTEPTQAQSGDVQLLLDDGSTLNAHSQYLEHASTVLRGALDCAHPAQDASASESGQQASDGSPDFSPACKRRRAQLRVPLPGVTRQQAVLLLALLYSFTREKFMTGLKPPQLLELARIADRLQCRDVLKLVDERLFRICSWQDVGASQDGWVNVKDAPALHALAHKLQLHEFADMVGMFLGMHMQEIDLTQLDASLATVMRGCRRFVVEQHRKLSKKIAAAA